MGKKRQSLPELVEEHSGIPGLFQCTECGLRVTKSGGGVYNSGIILTHQCWDRRFDKGLDKG